MKKVSEKTKRESKKDYSLGLINGNLKEPGIPNEREVKQFKKLLTLACW